MATAEAYEMNVQNVLSDFSLDCCGGDAGIIPQAGAVADLGIETLAHRPKGW